MTPTDSESKPKRPVNTPAPRKDDSSADSQSGAVDETDDVVESPPGDTGADD